MQPLRHHSIRSQNKCYCDAFLVADLPTSGHSPDGRTEEPGDATVSGAEPVDSERTAFRLAEKRYKLHKTHNPKSRKKPARSPTDPSGFVDFLSILQSFERGGDAPPGIYRFQRPGFDRPVFCFIDRSGDMLGGHLDDIGADWSKPIMSISLGCKSFALLGGKSREDNPRAMLLRGGYIVLMAGQARECFHGIPGIFTGDEHADISALLSHFSGKDDCFFMDYIRYSRININTR